MFASLMILDTQTKISSGEKLMREFLHTITICNDLSCDELTQINSLSFACKSMNCVFDQMLVSTKTYLIRIF